MIGLKMNISETMGDRILQLLRDRGRADRGREYEQKELVAFLNGEVRGPNGKFYDLHTSPTAISRLIKDGVNRLDRDLLEAICEMFDTSMDWIVRGREATNSGDHYITPEADAACNMIDAMEEGTRQLCVNIIRQIYGIDQERHEIETEIFDFMQGLALTWWGMIRSGHGQFFVK
jgi:hypothetical protein